MTHLSTLLVKYLLLATLGSLKTASKAFKMDVPFGNSIGLSSTFFRDKLNTFLGIFPKTCSSSKLKGIDDFVSSVANSTRPVPVTSPTTFIGHLKIKF